ncbi:hypothetical protein [Bacteroides heparinolyticus]|uniref:hypothetical protein n=1 Tax=Prevotella heparinolytica TaxID=28113 RepID=UPI0035A10234
MIQWFHSAWLLTRLARTRTFFPTVGMFALLGGVLTFLFAAFRGALNAQLLPLFIIDGIVFAVYGMIYWGLNYLLVRKQKKNGNFD